MSYTESGSGLLNNRYRYEAPVVTRKLGKNNFIYYIILHKMGATRLFSF
jgi:hypothetical protein